MKLNWRWLSPDAGEAAGGSGGDAGLTPGGQETPSGGDGGEPEGARPTLQVVPKEEKPVEPSWRDMLPEELRNDPKATPENIKELISRASRLAAAQAQKAHDEQIRRVEKDTQAEADRAVEQLYEDHERYVESVAEKLGDAANTPQGAAIIRREAGKSLIKTMAKIANATSQFTAKELREANRTQIAAKKAFFSNPKNQDVLGDPAAREYAEHQIEVDGRSGEEVLAELRRMKGSGLLRSVDPEEIEPLSADDLGPGVGVRAADRLRRINNGYGGTEVNRGITPRANKAEEKRYQSAETALIASMFPSQRKPSGYGG